MKKVLASILAGSMVLGMASMASATAIKKNSGSDDYDFGFMPAVLGEKFVGGIGTRPVEFKFPVTFTNTARAYKDAYRALKIAYDAEDVAAIKAAFVDLKADYEGFYTAFKALSAEDEAIINATYPLESKATLATRIKNEFPSVGYSSGDIAAVNTLVSLNGKKTYGKALAVVDPVIYAAQIALEVYPDENDIDEILAITVNETTGAVVDIGNIDNFVSIQNKDSFSLEWIDGEAWNLYTYGDDDAKEVTIRVAVPEKEDLRIDVAKGAVKIVRKKVPDSRAKILGFDIDNADVYDVTIKADAGVRDFELDDYKVEFDCHDSNLVFFVEGKVAYSDYRDVEPDERYINQESDPDDDHEDGCVYNFDQVIDEDTRIICNDYVDVLFNGNYGTDFENMRVMTDEVGEVEEFFSEYGPDIDYYDFVGTPKFAKDVTVRVDADHSSFIYEYDKETGDVVDITDECEYTSDGWTFKRKTLKTYVVLEEPYEGGNVRADKEPVDDEPTEPDDTDAAGSKPNPGTGAMPF